MSKLNRMICRGREVENMDAVELKKVNALTKLELLVAFVHCFDGDGCDNCEGCPLEDVDGCKYDLKMEIAERLMGRGQGA